MKVYVKVKKDGNSGLILGHSINFQKAISGFGDMGFEVIPYFSLDEVYEKITREDIVVDYIQQCEEILLKFGVSAPHVEDYPDCLKPFLERKIWKDTINSIAKDEKKWSAGWFVKPTEAKAFTGKRISSIKDLIGCGCFEKDYEVLCSEPVEFKREWRGFVYYDTFMDIRPYKGDYHYSYDPNTADNILKAFISWENRPCACAIDIGVTVDNKTLLVECNDGYALGAYGLENYKYARFLSARWAQLLQREDPCDFRKYGNMYHA